VSTLFELHEPHVTLVEYFCAHPCILPPQDGLPNVQIVITTTSLKITRLVVNQLTCLCYGASYHKNILCFRLIMWKLCDNNRYVINICDDTIYICHLMCDWSLCAHKIMHSICSLKIGVTLISYFPIQIFSFDLFISTTNWCVLIGNRCLRLFYKQQHVTAQLEGPICLLCAINILCCDSLGLQYYSLPIFWPIIKHFSMTIDTFFKIGRVIYKKKEREIRITNYCKGYNQLLLDGK
jgi:hypothetical protein